LLYTRSLAPPSSITVAALWVPSQPFPSSVVALALTSCLQHKFVYSMPTFVSSPSKGKSFDLFYSSMFWFLSDWSYSVFHRLFGVLLVIQRDHRGVLCGKLALFVAAFSPGNSTIKFAAPAPVPSLQDLIRFLWGILTSPGLDLRHDFPGLPRIIFPLAMI